MAATRQQTLAQLQRLGSAPSPVSRLQPPPPPPGSLESQVGALQHAPPPGCHSRFKLKKPSSFRGAFTMTLSGSPPPRYIPVLC